MLGIVSVGTGALPQSRSDSRPLSVATAETINTVNTVNSEKVLESGGSIVPSPIMATDDGVKLARLCARLGNVRALLESPGRSGCSPPGPVATRPAAKANTAETEVPAEAAFPTQPLQAARGAKAQMTSNQGAAEHGDFEQHVIDLTVQEVRAAVRKEMDAWGKETLDRLALLEKQQLLLQQQQEKNSGAEWGSAVTSKSLSEFSGSTTVGSDAPDKFNQLVDLVSMLEEHVTGLRLAVAESSNDNAAHTNTGATDNRVTDIIDALGCVWSRLQAHQSELDKLSSLGCNGQGCPPPAAAAVPEAFTRDIERVEKHLSSVKAQVDKAHTLLEAESNVVRNLAEHLRRLDGDRSELQRKVDGLQKLLESEAQERLDSHRALTSSIDKSLHQLVSEIGDMRKHVDFPGTSNVAAAPTTLLQAHSAPSSGVPTTPLAAQTGSQTSGNVSPMPSIPPLPLGNAACSTPPPIVNCGLGSGSINLAPVPGPQKAEDRISSTVPAAVTMHREERTSGSAAGSMPLHREERISPTLAGHREERPSGGAVGSMPLHREDRMASTVPGNVSMHREERLSAGAGTSMHREERLSAEAAGRVSMHGTMLNSMMMQKGSMQPGSFTSPPLSQPVRDAANDRLQASCERVHSPMPCRSHSPQPVPASAGAGVMPRQRSRPNAAAPAPTLPHRPNAMSPMQGFKVLNAVTRQQSSQPGSMNLPGPPASHPQRSASPLSHQTGAGSLNLSGPQPAHEVYFQDRLQRVHQQ